MRLHKRYRQATEAKLEIQEAVAIAIKKHDLTYSELWAILCEVGMSWAKWAIQDERKK